MLPQEQTIFKKVGQSEKKVIFKEIAGERVQLSVKGSDDRLFNLVAIQTEKDEIILCHLTENATDLKAEKVVVNFPLRSERYFFQTELALNSGWAVLRIDVDLFQLQRRANARLDLPDEYDALFVLQSVGTKSVFINCKIRDISAGGLKIEFPPGTPELKMSDMIKGSMRLGIRRPLEFEMEVRFAQKRPDGFQIGGVQFKNIDHFMENRLLSLMMDLQREIWLRFSAKKDNKPFKPKT